MLIVENVKGKVINMEIFKVGIRIIVKLHIKEYIDDTIIAIIFIFPFLFGSIGLLGWLTGAKIEINTKQIKDNIIETIFNIW